MFSKGRKQTAVLLALLGLLLVTYPAAAGFHEPSAGAAPEGRGAETFGWRVWQWLRALWGEHGPCIDPDGCPESDAGSAPDQLDQGPHIDPNGCPQAG